MCPEAQRVEHHQREGTGFPAQLLARIDPGQPAGVIVGASSGRWCVWEAVMLSHRLTGVRAIWPQSAVRMPISRRAHKTAIGRAGIKAVTNRAPVARVSLARRGTAL